MPVVSARDRGASARVRGENRRKAANVPDPDTAGTNARLDTNDEVADAAGRPLCTGFPGRSPTDLGKATPSGQEPADRSSACLVRG
ncbi:MAG: hypothetical protein M3N98_14575, partial [Actinomycetota bacterium]|nr:hypothetical protein [Actinomycetota bacterium]